MEGCGRAPVFLCDLAGWPAEPGLCAGAATIGSVRQPALMFMGLLVGGCAGYYAYLVSRSWSDAASAQETRGAYAAFSAACFLLVIQRCFVPVDATVSLQAVAFFTLAAASLFWLCVVLAALVDAQTLQKPPQERLFLLAGCYLAILALYVLFAAVPGAQLGLFILYDALYAVCAAGWLGLSAYGLYTQGEYRRPVPFGQEVLMVAAVCSIVTPIMAGPMFAWLCDVTAVFDGTFWAVFAAGFGLQAHFRFFKGISASLLFDATFCEEPNRAMQAKTMAAGLEVGAEIDDARQRQADDEALSAALPVPLPSVLSPVSHLSAGQDEQRRRGSDVSGRPVPPSAGPL